MVSPMSRHSYWVRLKSERREPGGHTSRLVQFTDPLAVGIGRVNRG